MQSEIDDIRTALELLHIANDSLVRPLEGEIADAQKDALEYISQKLTMIEAQQAVNSDVVMLPVTTLEQLTVQAMRDKRARMTLVQGGGQ